MKRYLLRTPTNDYGIKDGLFEAIESHGTLKSDQYAEYLEVGSDHLVSPGLIDLHVHLREPGEEWKEDIASGSRASLLGGFTHICCMPNTKPVNDSPEVTAFIREQSKKVGVRVSPIGAVSKGLKGEEFAPLYDLYEAGCVAFSDDGAPIHDPLMMRRALEITKSLKVPITAHEEEKSLTRHGVMNESALSLAMGLKGMPKAAEDIMIARDIELARLTGGHVHICHLSSGRSVHLIRRAKSDGINITAEVTPHHLMLTEKEVGNYDTNAKMSPPLREEEDIVALLEGLNDGTIDCIASDHAPHDTECKRVEFVKASFGILGLQTTLPLCLELVRGKKISMAMMMKALTYNPAKIFNLPGGEIKVGSPADLIVIDLQSKFTLANTNASKSTNSPFWEVELQGRARHVFVGGRLLVKDFCSHQS
jgi:dihydroorotase